jgi:predicted nucleotidyltransferase/DNA-binding XRE family transcriptional regulator
MNTSVADHDRRYRSDRLLTYYSPSHTPGEGACFMSAFAAPIDDPRYAESMDDMVSGALLRDARRRAGLSQSEMARRAQVAQSVISAYESGHREPALSTLARLVAATGQRLAITLETADPDVRGLPNTSLGRRLRQRRAALIAAAERHGASNLRVFGSVARSEDRPDSDVDLLVDMPLGTGLFGLEKLERELQEILNVEVDLAPVDSLKPRIRINAEREAIPL